MSAYGAPWALLHLLGLKASVYVNNQHASHYVCLSAIIGLLLGAVSVSQAAPPVFSSPNRVTLLRVIKGAELRPFTGQPNGKLRLFSDLGNGLEPIPFQIDEINSQGEFIYDDNPPAVADERPGVLDDNDELAFVLPDVGYRVHTGRWPGGHKVGREIAVTDPVGGRGGYVYLFAFDNPPAPSKKRHVRYDAKSDRGESDDIVIGFDDNNPIIFDEIRIVEYKGGMGRGKGVNLIDRLKVRMTGRTLGDLVEVERNEEDVDAELVGVRSGPVRVIRTIKGVVTIGPMSVPLLVQYQMGPRTIRVPVEFTLPGKVTAFLNNVDLVIGVDFRDARGTTFSTLAMARGTLVDGRLSPVERAIPMGNEEWIMLTGNGINIFAVIDLDRDLTLKKEIHFLDDPNADFGPENVPGQLPEIGFRFLNWTSLEGRTYHFDATVSALPGFPLGGGSGFYKAIHTPPIIELGPGKLPTALIVHESAISSATLGSIQSALKSAASGTLAGLELSSAPVKGSARAKDLDQIAARSPDLVVMLADADPTQVAERLERRGVRVVSAAVGGGGDPLAVPVDRVVAMLRQSVQENGRVLVPLAPGKASALWEQYKEAAARLRVNLERVDVPADAGPAEAIKAAMSGAVAGLILPDQYWTAGNWKRFSEALRAFDQGGNNPVPVFTTGKEAVERGAVLGLEMAAGVSTSAIVGQSLAALQGKPAPQGAGGQSGNTQFYVNTDALKRGRFQLPIQIVKNATIVRTKR